MTYTYNIKCLDLGANIPGNTKKKSRWTFMKDWCHMYIFVPCDLSQKVPGNRRNLLKAKSEGNVQDPHVSSGFSWQSKVKVRAQPRSVT